MTAEIGILNKTAVALAADSAVTVQKAQGQKIYNSANKLFSLSKYHPVGIMLFGGASFMGIPWETIIKVYRSRLGKKSFKTLKEYANNLIEFVKESGANFVPQKQQEQYIKAHIWIYYQFMKDEIKKALDNAVKDKSLKEEDIRLIVRQIIENKKADIEKSSFLDEIAEKNKNGFINKHGKDIDEITNKVFENLPLEDKSKADLKDIAIGLFYRAGTFTNDSSGIVIAGFGEDEIFPSIHAFQFECLVEGVLKYTPLPQKTGEISFENNAMITPFAQSEMVHTFIEGIDPSLEQLSIGYLSKIFSQYPDTLLKQIVLKYEDGRQDTLNKLKGISDAILKDYIEQNKKYRQDVHISPILSIVGILPKDELASMAEALVNLTWFKRRITMDAETVGGPIDVAVISKGDGFVWIKRKHYFAPQLNPQFFENYFREGDEI